MHAYGYDKKASTQYPDMITRPRLTENPKKVGSITTSVKPIEAPVSGGKHTSGHAAPNPPANLGTSTRRQACQAKYREDLAQQVAAAKSNTEQRGTQDLETGGLPLGKYRPVSKQEYKAALDRQLQERAGPASARNDPPRTLPAPTLHTSRAAQQAFRESLDSQVRAKQTQKPPAAQAEATSLQVGSKPQKIQTLALQQPELQLLGGRPKERDQPHTTVQNTVSSVLPERNRAIAARSAYKQQLDEQVQSQSRAASISNRDLVYSADYSSKIAGFRGMGGHTSDLATWKTELAQQVQQRNDQKAKLHASAKALQSFHNKEIPNMIMDENLPKDDSAQFRADLLEQINSREVQRNNQKAESIRLDKSATGLELSENTRNNHETKTELAAYLKAQIHHNEAAKKQNENKKSTLSQSYGDLQRENSPHEAHNRGVAEYMSGLLSQIQDDQRRKSLWKLAHLQSERNHQGLPIGDYVPYDKSEYGDYLRNQIHIRRSSKQKAVPPNSSLKQMDSEFEQLGHEYSGSYLKELKKEIQDHRDRRSADRSFEIMQERNATGLKLQPGPSYDKKELREILLKQILDKQNHKSTSIKELEDRVAWRQVEEEYLLGQLRNLKAERASMEQNAGDSRICNLAQELAIQAESDHQRKKKSAQQQKVGKVSLDIGDYRPLDKRKYRLELQEQMKGNQKKQSTEKALLKEAEISLLADTNRQRFEHIPQETLGVNFKASKNEELIHKEQEKARISYQAFLQKKSDQTQLLVLDHDVVPEPDLAQLGHKLIIAKDAFADSIKHANLDRAPHEVKRKASQAEDYAILKNIMRNEQKIVQSELEISEKIRLDFKNQL